MILHIIAFVIFGYYLFGICIKELIHKHLLLQFFETNLLCLPLATFQFGKPPIEIFELSYTQLEVPDPLIEVSEYLPDLIHGSLLRRAGLVRDLCRLLNKLIEVSDTQIVQEEGLHWLSRLIGL